VQKLVCTMCGCVLEPKDDFEAGLYTAWHMADTHAKVDRRDFVVTTVAPRGDDQAIVFIECDRQTMQ